MCEPCKLYLDNDEDIPLPLLSKLIKYKLLDVKQTDIKRREAEKKVGILTYTEDKKLVKISHTY